MNIPKKIMIVDDDPSQIYTIKTLFEYSDEKENYEVLPANSGEECLDLLSNNQIPDLILLDIMMPGMNGMVVLEKIKENPSWRHIPIAFLTATSAHNVKERGRNLGDDFIQKPIEADNFLERIKKLTQPNQTN